jgi:DNA-binding response OmpR family regulator
MEPPAARILIVDDEAPIRMTLERLLQRRGYAVLAADSGEQALALLDQHTFDLLILDLKLPGISGLDVAQRARALQPTAAILLLTGHANLGDGPDASGVDEFEYLLKTTSPEDVLARVATIIKQRTTSSSDTPQQ